MSQIPFLIKKKLEKDMKLLDNNEYREVLNILKQNQQKYSSNSKGIFFNLKYVDDSTIKDIIKFVEFCKKNKIYLEKKIVNHSTPESHPLNITNNFHDDKQDITIDIENILKKQSKISNNFTFQNYIDKISIVPKKEFKNKQISKYPDIININNEFTGSNNRILKKCKNFESSYFHSSSETDNANFKKNILEPELNLR